MPLIVGVSQKLRIDSFLLLGGVQCIRKLHETSRVVSVSMPRLASTSEARASDCVSIYSRCSSDLPFRMGLMAATQRSSNVLFVAAIFPLAKPMTRTPVSVQKKRGGQEKARKGKKRQEKPRKGVDCQKSNLSEYKFPLGLESSAPQSRHILSGSAPP